MAQPTPAPAPIVGEHTLPSGAVVVFTDPEDLTGDDVQAVLDSVGLTPGDMDDQGNVRGGVGMGVRIARAVASRLIESWQVPYLPDAAPPVQDPAALGRLKARDFAAVIVAAAPAVKLFTGELATPDDAAVPDSPTGPASA